MFSPNEGFRIFELFYLALNNKNKKLLYIAPFKHKIDYSWRLLVLASAPFGVSFFHQAKKVEFPNGSEIRLIRADNPNDQKLKGIRFDTIVIDEVVE